MWLDVKMIVCGGMCIVGKLGMRERGVVCQMISLFIV